MTETVGYRDPRIPPAEDCVLPYLVDCQAASLGDKAFVVFYDGASWTYTETRRKTLSSPSGHHNELLPCLQCRI